MNSDDKITGRLALAKRDLTPQSQTFRARRTSHYEDKPESVILNLLDKEERGTLPFLMYTLSRRRSLAGWGTQKIQCNRVAGDCKGWEIDSIVLGKELPNYIFAKGELEDANVWQSSKENPGWRKLDDEYGIYKDKQKKQTRYELDILDDCDLNSTFIPIAAIQEWIPSNTFSWLSEQVGREVSLDEFAGECLAFFPQVGAPHQLEVSKYKPRREIYNKKLIKSDACLAIYGSNGIDRDYPGEALFFNGRFITGGIGAVCNAKTAEDFKQGIKKYFKLPVYGLFEVFFCAKGLPESHREAIKDIL